MGRPIDADELKRKLIDEKGFFPAIVAKAIDEMPTVEVTPTNKNPIKCPWCGQLHN